MKSVFEELNQLYEAQEIIDITRGESDYPTFQLTFDDFDENGELKPEVQAAIDRRVDLRKATKDPKIKFSWDELQAEEKLKQEVAAKKKAWKAALQTGKNTEKLGKEYLDAYNQYLKLQAKNKYIDTARQTARANLSNDIYNNNKLIQTEYSYPKIKSNFFDNLEKEEKITPDFFDGLDKEEKDKRIEYANKINGQTWWDFNNPDGPVLMQKALTPEAKKYMEINQGYKPNSWDYADVPVEDPLNQDFPDPYDEILQDLKDGKITKDEAKKKLSKLNK